MKQVSITKAVKIKNQRVKPFAGEKEYLATGGLIGDKVETEKVTYKTKPSRADLLVAENQLIVARMKETNKVLLIDENTSDLIVSTGFLVLDVQDGWHSGFLFHYFVSSFFQKQKDKLSIGATQKAINNNKFKEILIPEIPFEDQIRIVKILDEADALRQKRKQAIGLLDDYLKSVFLEMFGDPVRNEKGWGKISIAKVTEVRGRVGWKGYKKTDLRDSGPYVLGATHLSSCGCLDLSKPVYISREKFNESPEIVVQINDLLIVQRGNTIGKVSLVDTDIGEATINPCILILRPTNINTYFLKQYFMHNKVLQQLWNKNSSSAQPMLTQKDIRAFEVYNPPIILQNKFVVIVKIIDSIKKTMLAQSAELETQFQALMQKAFKSSIVTL